MEPAPPEPPPHPPPSLSTVSPLLFHSLPSLCLILVCASACHIKGEPGVTEPQARNINAADCMAVWEINPLKIAPYTSWTHHQSLIGIAPYRNSLGLLWGLFRYVMDVFRNIFLERCYNASKHPRVWGDGDESLRRNVREKHRSRNRKITFSWAKDGCHCTHTSLPRCVINVLIFMSSTCEATEPGGWRREISGWMINETKQTWHGTAAEPLL